MRAKTTLLLSQMRSFAQIKTLRDMKRKPSVVVKKTLTFLNKSGTNQLNLLFSIVAPRDLSQEKFM